MVHSAFETGPKNGHNSMGQKILATHDTFAVFHFLALFVHAPSYEMSHI